MRPDIPHNAKAPPTIVYRGASKKSLCPQNQQSQYRPKNPIRQVPADSVERIDLLPDGIRLRWQVGIDPDALAWRGQKKALLWLHGALSLCGPEFAKSVLMALRRRGEISDGDCESLIERLGLRGA